MGKGSGMTRGDRRRNARRERLRGLLPRDGAVIGIDLGEEKQAVVVVDHDVRVLARKTVRVKAFRLGEALEWAVGRARAKGFASVTVACEPTGPRWLQVQRLCAERARLARPQAGHRPAPGLPPQRRTHPRPRHLVLARPPPGPHRRDRHRRHLEQHRRRAGPAHPRHLHRPGRHLPADRRAHPAQRHLLAKLSIPPPKKIIETTPAPAS
jgi:hypothetical protein